MWLVQGDVQSLEGQVVRHISCLVEELGLHPENSEVSGSLGSRVTWSDSCFRSGAGWHSSHSPHVAVKPPETWLIQVQMCPKHTITSLSKA